MSESCLFMWLSWELVSTASLLTCVMGEIVDSMMQHPGDSCTNVPSPKTNKQTMMTGRQNQYTSGKTEQINRDDGEKPLWIEFKYQHLTYFKRKMFNEDLL